MGLKEFGQSVSRDGGARRRRGEGWPAMLRRWLVECPRCAGVWLVVGARENDHYVCKGCGHGFVIRLPSTPEGGLPEPVAAGRESQ